MKVHMNQKIGFPDFFFFLDQAQGLDHDSKTDAVPKDPLPLT